MHCSRKNKEILLFALLAHETNSVHDEMAIDFALENINM
jgi:hypothetical protein